MDNAPVIEEGVRFNMYDDKDDRVSTIIVLGLWIDEDGNAQIRINDNWSEKRIVTVDDIYELLQSAYQWKCISRA